MKDESKRLRSSIVLLALAIALGSVALSAVFAKHPIVFSKSARADEIIIDVIGMLGSALASAAAVLMYPLRKRIWVRLYLTFTIFVAIGLALEFFLGFLWFAYDKFVPFGQHK